MFRSNNTEEIITKALSLLVAPKKETNIEHDDLFNLIVKNTYELGKG
ncbi:MAG: hypothetical protein LBR24_01620 [Methanobrevibacter sp.]|nr:hypothetical protein [Methanobrevibacter sp.]